MTINSPGGVAGPCTAAAADFGPVFNKTRRHHGRRRRQPTPPTPTGPSTTDGCSAFNNAAAVAGKFVYVDRGTCAFQIKIDNAVAAGATGIVVGDNVAGLPRSRSRVSPTLPGLMVTQADGTKFKSAGTANVTIKPRTSSARTPTPTAG